MSWKRSSALWGKARDDAYDDSTLKRQDVSYTKEKNGFLSFFRWFRRGRDDDGKSEGETVSPSLSRHSGLTTSTSSINTLVSTASSFAVLPVCSYNGPTEGQQRIVHGTADVDLYRRRWHYRDRKGISLKKKYHLHSCESLARHNSTDTLETGTIRPRSSASMDPSSLRRKKRRAPQPPGAVSSYNDLSLPSTLESRHDKPSQLNIIVPCPGSSHRRTASDPYKERPRTGYCHVRGKRRAPPPPVASGNTSEAETIHQDACSPAGSAKRSKKKAPPCPPVEETIGEGARPKQSKQSQANRVVPDKSKLSSEQRQQLIDNISKLKAHARRRSMGSPTQSPVLNRAGESRGSEQYSNDSLKLEKGVLKHSKEIQKVDTKNGNDNKISLSPRPWYKRSARKEANYKSLEKEKEKDMWMPEVGVPRSCIPLSTSIDETFAITDKQKDTKRRSQVSLLASISELDREASEIVQREQEKQRTKNEEGSECYYVTPEDGLLLEIPNKENDNNKNLDNNSDESKAQSAKELISFFNSFNVSKIVINTSLYPCLKNIENSDVPNADMTSRKNASDMLKDISSDSDSTDIIEWIANFDAQENSRPKKQSALQSEYQPTAPSVTMINFGSPKPGVSKSQCIFEYNKQHRHLSPSPSIPTITEMSESTGSLVSACPTSLPEELPQTSNTSQSIIIKPSEISGQNCRKGLLENWECTRCTLFNPWWNQICDACYSRKPPKVTAVPKERNWEEELAKYFGPSISSASAGVLDRGTDNSKNLRPNEESPENIWRSSLHEVVNGDVKQKIQLLEAHSDRSSERDKNKQLATDIRNGDVMEKVFALESKQYQEEIKNSSGQRQCDFMCDNKVIKNIHQEESSQIDVVGPNFKPLGDNAAQEESVDIAGACALSVMNNTHIQTNDIYASVACTSKLASGIQHSDNISKRSSTSTKMSLPQSQLKAPSAIPSTFIGGKLPQDKKTSDNGQSSSETEKIAVNGNTVSNDVKAKESVEDVRQARLAYFQKPASPNICDKGTGKSDSSPKVNASTNTSTTPCSVMIALGKLEKLENKVNSAAANKKYKVDMSKISETSTEIKTKTVSNSLPPDPELPAVSKLVSVRPKEPLNSKRMSLKSPTHRKSDDRDAKTKESDCTSPDEKANVSVAAPSSPNVSRIPTILGAGRDKDSKAIRSPHQWGRKQVLKILPANEKCATRSSITAISTGKQPEETHKPMINPLFKDHVYENVQNKCNSKPEKVSTSVQTSAVLKKMDEQSNDSINSETGEKKAVPNGELCQSDTANTSLVSGNILYTSLSKKSGIGTGTFELIGAKDFASRTGARAKTTKLSTPSESSRIPRSPAMIKKLQFQISQKNPESTSPGSSHKTQFTNHNVTNDAPLWSSKESSANLNSGKPLASYNQGKSISERPELEKGDHKQREKVDVSPLSNQPHAEVHYPSVLPYERELSRFVEVRSKKVTSVPSSNNMGEQQSYFAYMKEVDRLAEQLTRAKGLADFKATLESTSPDKNVNTLAVNKLLRKLEASIAGGQHQEASSLAKQLAMLKVQCSVTRFREGENRVLQDGPKSVKVNMFVEDKVSHQGPIPIQLDPEMTVGQLKYKIQQDYEIPAKVQRWILGRQLASVDEKTLSSHDVRCDGCSIFLYLVAPGTAEEVSIGDMSSAGQKSLVVPEVISSDVSSSLQTNDPKCTSVNSDDTVDDAVSVDIQPSAHAKEEEIPEVVVGWSCTACTYFNFPIRPGCEICSTPRPADYTVPDDYRLSSTEKEWLQETAMQQEALELAIAEEKAVLEHQRHENFWQIINMENIDVIANNEPDTCPICYGNIPPGQGVVLRECLHVFCKECLVNTVQYSEEAQIKCPYRDDQYSCEGTLQDREIKGLVSPEIYEQHLAKSINVAENNTENAFHCKTPDCRGWCVFDDNVNVFNCPVCNAFNCLTCQAIHEGMDCRQYQEKLRADAFVDEAARKTQAMLDEMLQNEEALKCPQCQVILLKKWGCDWVRCSMCKTEICWVTRGLRWGPMGKGDVSGGCRCGVNGAKCHPRCNYCH